MRPEVWILPAARAEVWIFPAARGQLLKSAPGLGRSDNSVLNPPTHVGAGKASTVAEDHSSGPDRTRVRLSAAPPRRQPTRIVADLWSRHVDDGGGLIIR